MKPFVIIALASVLFAGPRDLIAAQTPDGTPIVITGECVVEPMPQERIDELASLASTPIAPVTATPIDLSQGQPVSDGVRAELRAVIQQSEVCAQLQDLPRLLSLYSEQFIVEQFFADEPVQIVPTINGTPTGSSIPPGATDQENMLMDAVLLPDGRVAANVSSNAWGGNQRLYLFVQQDGRWVIDRIEGAPGEFPVGGESDVTIPAEAQAIVDLVLNDAATQLGVEPSALSITSIEPMDWPDSSLGCPEDGGVYAQVISPGYRIIVTDGAASLEYHTGPNDIIVACSS